MVDDPSSVSLPCRGSNHSSSVSLSTYLIIFWVAPSVQLYNCTLITKMPQENLKIFLPNKRKKHFNLKLEKRMGGGGGVLV